MMSALKTHNEYLFADHLGSVAVTSDLNGAKLSEVRFMPWGADRYTYGSAPTSYRYTGQRIEQSLGIYFYNSRFYDPQVGRFAQADTVIPNPGDPASFDRYAYVRNNPLRYTDPTGHFMIAGWDNRYLQTQVGNTCAVVAIAVAFSILTGYKFTQQDIQPLAPNTKWSIPEMNLPVIGKIQATDGLGVLPFQQKLMVDAMGGFTAEATHGTRSELMDNLKNGIPTIVTIALDPDKGWGHALVVVGCDDKTGELLFFNPAYGKIQSESELLKYDQYNPGQRYTTFDELWAGQNYIIGGNNMVTVQVASPPNCISYPSGGGHNNTALNLLR
jgi:RHS repeat-associated protein